jgi:uncharacterized protein YndB with AHSA1/START domain
MPVTSVHKDPATLTMAIASEWDAPIDRVWSLWADPRRLERWWGPPTYPATVEEHDLRPGGKVTYVMTGPEGDRHPGWWRVVAVDAPHRLELVDGFATPDGTPDESMPATRIVVTCTTLAGGRTQMVIESVFPSTAAMEQLIAMGMEEGMQAAMGQIDAVLVS